MTVWVDRQGYPLWGAGYANHANKDPLELYDAGESMMHEWYRTLHAEDGNLSGLLADWVEERTQSPAASRFVTFMRARFNKERPAR